MELTPSKLGTKAYWSSHYQEEIRSFESDGDIWFGEHTMHKLVNWLKDSNEVTTQSQILDLGCGNGATLVELAKSGFENLTGCDYAQEAIVLAEGIAKKEQHQITYVVADILNIDACPTLKGKQYDVCIDKGTYDAISLNPEKSKACRQAYKQAVCHLLKTDGVFLLASCNWTLEELKDFFTSDFRLVQELPSPKFTFGGSTGQSVTSAVWVKKAKS